MAHDIPVKVFIRVRPLSNKEKDHGCAECVQCLEETSQLIIAEKMFKFDGVFAPNTAQSAVHEVTTGSLVEHLFKGFNCTILAYGQTGSGKTYTMGTEDVTTLEDDDNRGITPRIILDIFENIATSNSDVTVSVSMLEIYNENVWDLLAKGERNDPLQIRENPRGGVIVPNLTKFPAKDFHETMDFLVLGCRQRSKGGTAMNLQSSRSHAVFTITLNKSAIDDESDAFESKLHLVDLAGSERLKKTLAEGDRKKEGIQINQGLLALGNVISALTEPGQVKHVPYRDSKITRLLQDGLGGNSYTVFIACVSPADTNAEESLSTLRYAERARSIKNKPVLNVDPAAATIQKLKATIADLRIRLAESNPSSEAPMLNTINMKEHERLQAKCDVYENKLGELLSTKSMMHSKLVKMEEERDYYRGFYEDIKNITVDKADKNTHPVIDDLLRILENFSNEQTQDEEVENDLKDEMETIPDKSINDSMENHIDIQANLQEEFENLSKQIQERERLISKNLENELEIDDAIRKNQEYVESLQSQISKIKAEKDELASSLKKITISNKLSEERRKRLQELEKQLAKYERSQSDLNKMKKLKAETDKEKKRLQEQIHELKVARVKMAKQLKEESLKYRQFIQKHNMEINKLKQTERKREFQLTKEKADMARQLDFYRRRYEEATKSRKRLDKKVEDQKVGTSLRSESTNDFKNFLDHELDIISSRQDATLSRISLIEQRKEMSGKVSTLKRKLKALDKPRSSKNKKENEKDKETLDELNKEMQNLENEIELLTVEINEIQAKCEAVDENAGIDKQINAMKTLQQAHSAIRLLFEKLVEKNKLQLEAERALNELKQLYADCIEEVKEEKEEVNRVAKERQTKLLKLQKKHQEFVDIICHLRADLRSIETKLSNTELDSVGDMGIILSKISLIRQQLENADDEDFIHKLTNETKRRTTQSKTLRKLTSKLALKHGSDEEEPEFVVPAKRSRKTVQLAGFKNTFASIKTEEEPENDEDYKSPARNRPWEKETKSKAKKTNNQISFDEMEEDNENEPLSFTQNSVTGSADMNRTYTVVQDDDKNDIIPKKSDDALSRSGLVGLNRRRLEMPKL